MRAAFRGPLGIVAAVVLGCAPRAQAQAWGDDMNYEVGGWGANVNTLTVGPG